VLGGITGPAQQRPTDTVTKEPPTARHTVPATVGTHEDGAELPARCCSANSAADQHPEPIQPEQLGGHGRRGSSVARPIPTSSRPSTGRQDRHNLELGPVAPAGQALLAAGRVRDGDMAARTPTPPRSARRGDFPASAQ